MELHGFLIPMHLAIHECSGWLMVVKLEAAKLSSVEPLGQKEWHPSRLVGGKNERGGIGEREGACGRVTCQASHQAVSIMEVISSLNKHMYLS